MLTRDPAAPTLDPARVIVDPRLAEGYCADAYFSRAREVLRAAGRRAIVRWQVFQKHHAVLCGMDEALATMRAVLGPAWSALRVEALADGSGIVPNETVLLVEGDLALFTQLETVVLGILARRTRIATNAAATVRAANQRRRKQVLFFPARFDIWQAQEGDGYAFEVGARTAHAAARTATDGDDEAAADVPVDGASTPAQCAWVGGAALGTVPHALEAAFGGDVVAATLAFAEHVDPAIPRVALVDYDNDCVGTTLAVARALRLRFEETGDERYRLAGVRLDTSSELVDRALQSSAERAAGHDRVVGDDDRAGVTVDLVWAVRDALDAAARAEADPARAAWFDEVRIMVSGGFTPARIEAFEHAGAPVDGYGVGSSMLHGSFDFTADVVALEIEGEWCDEAKVGRAHHPNARLRCVRG